MDENTQNAQDAPRPPAVRYSEAGAAVFQLLRELDRCAAPFSRQLSPGRDAVLRALATGGPQTMSQIARARSVSRQAAARVTRALAREGLLETRANPRHRRAPLFALSQAGTAAYHALARREATRLNNLARSIPANQLRAATRTLKKLREHAAR